MNHTDFWIVVVILLWIAYDTREIRKRLNRLEKEITAGGRGTKAKTV
jgi:hypothetical protein